MRRSALLSRLRLEQDAEERLFKPYHMSPAGRDADPLCRRPLLPEPLVTLLYAAVSRVRGRESGIGGPWGNHLAASVDTLAQARGVVSRGLTFLVAYGTTREESEVFGAWWEGERGFMQPAEFLLGRGGVVLGSMYASGPVGRMGADEAVRLITTRKRRRHEQEAGAP